MTNPVAPVKGHYALLRNGSFVHPECITEDFDLDDTPYYLPANSDEDYYWTPQGVCQRQTYPKGLPKVIFVPDCDIIATISPADMQAAASGELERLRAALSKAEIEREYWRGFAVQTKQQVEGFLKRLQDWTNEGELIQGGYNAGT